MSKGKKTSNKPNPTKAKEPVAPEKLATTNTDPSPNLSNKNSGNVASEVANASTNGAANDSQTAIVSSQEGSSESAISANSQVISENAATETAMSNLTEQDNSETKNGKEESIMEYKMSAISESGTTKSASHTLFDEFSQNFMRRAEDKYTKRLSSDQLQRNIEELVNFISERKPNEIKVRAIVPHESGLDPNEELVAIETCMEDQSFIVDTIKLTLKDLKLPIVHAITILTPTKRDADGKLLSLHSEDESHLESATRFLVSKAKTEEVRNQVVAEVKNRLEMARAAVHAYLRLKKLGGEIVNEYLYMGQIYPQRKDKFEQVSKFLKWLLEDHFVFYGASFFHHTLQADKGLGAASYLVNDNSSISIAEHFFQPSKFNKDQFEEIDLVKFVRTDISSKIHRAGKLCDVLFRRFDDTGKPIGGIVFHGLLTQKAMSAQAITIPMITQRLDTMLKNAEVGNESHRYRAMRKAFDAIPIEVLLDLPQKSLGELVEAAVRAESLGEAVAQVAFFAEQRSLAAFVMVSQEVFSDNLRETLENALIEDSQANTSEFRVTVGFGRLIGLYFFLTGCQRNDISSNYIEAHLVSLCTPWVEQLGQAMAPHYDAETAKRLQQYFGHAFPEDYQRTTSPTNAVRDLSHLEVALQSGEMTFDFFQETADLEANHLRLRLYNKIQGNAALFLSDVLPILDHFGFRVIDQDGIVLSFEDGNQMQMDTFRISAQENAAVLFERKDLLVKGLRSVFRGDVQSDKLNCLIPNAGLNWDEVDMLRAYVGYALQIRPTLAQEAVVRVLTMRLEATNALVDLFHARFSPEGERNAEGQITNLATRIEHACEKLKERLHSIQDATEDRVLRILFNLIQSTVRTNFYRTDRKSHYISFKIDCSKLEVVPEPRPKFEIFVHAKTVEGVHLRGGRIARGGLRWSDRLDDYRTEVFGLMRTQMVKNVLIVPVGAKGGFILKSEKPGQDRRAFADKMYETFIRGLVDVTDNIVDGKTVPPPNVVSHDEPDPYLVVAADKGTAHLSDTANRIAEEYGFWLSDAFASGGSKGYDHKIYAITARGAWACARHHFSFLGMDPEKDVITVTGVGDMSGDVFGNGLILSRTIKLLGAFDHRHIILDPNPDPEQSYQERLRLFNLPRSSWSDYSRDVLSKGGGVFSRTDKEIPLSPECQDMLGINEAAAPPELVIQKLLTLNVDMLWNGGIGTFIKSSEEDHSAVGDKINDNIRVNAKDVRAKIIGEGGNLGLTQRARIEYAKNGGRINTDAIDNSGGVDLSDHEVNLKILLAPLVAQGSVSIAERNDLIKEVANEVCTKVVENNYSHAMLLAMDQMRSKQDPHAFLRAAAFLEEQGVGIPPQEQFPTTNELTARGSQMGLFRPELAKIMAYMKMYVADELLKSDPLRFPDNDELLNDYFPKEITNRFKDAIDHHLLLRELLVTIRTSKIMEFAGATFFPDLIVETNRSVADVAIAYSTASHWLGADKLRAQVMAVEEVPAEHRYQSLITIEDNLREATSWLLHFLPGELLWKRGMLLGKSGSTTGQLSVVVDYPNALSALRENLSKAAVRAWQRVEQDAAKLQRLGLPEQLALEVGFTNQWPKVFPIAELGGRTKRSLSDVANVYLTLGQRTHLNALILRIGRQPALDIWEALALRSLRASLVRILFEFASKVLSSNVNPEEVLDSYPAFLTIAQEISRAQPNPNAPVAVSILVVVAEKLRKALDRVQLEPTDQE